MPRLKKTSIEKVKSGKKGGKKTSIEKAKSWKKGGKKTSIEKVQNGKKGAFRNRAENNELINLSFEDLENPYNFYNLMQSPIFNQWLRKNKLLTDHLECEKCDGRQCTLMKRVKHINGESFRCKGSNSHEYSIRKFSFFENTKYAIQDVLAFVLEFCLSSTMKRNSKVTGVSYGKTSVDYCSYIREICVEYVWKCQSKMKFTGTVEIDESLFGRKIKDNKGKKRNPQVWIFGLVERETNRIIMYPVESRNEETLLPLIKRHCMPGTTIFSDGWSAYQNLNDHGYEHFSVIHKKAFSATYKNVNTGRIIKVNTNRIEGAWGHAKNHFRKIYGASRKTFYAHLCEIMWRNHHIGQNLFKCMMEQIAEIYDVEKLEMNFTYDQNVFSLANVAKDDLFMYIEDESYLKHMDVTGLIQEMEHSQEPDAPHLETPEMLYTTTDIDLEIEKKTNQSVELKSDIEEMSPGVVRTSPINQNSCHNTSATSQTLFSNNISGISKEDPMSPITISPVKSTEFSKPSLFGNKISAVNNKELASERKKLKRKGIHMPSNFEFVKMGNETNSRNL
ncbi:uncharacterized protein [Clytia hemisphaerica]|uniref:uncharacterized protein n=1 Tax=Clytia hemisphaerica TaxID=252671 RepID=UPI0034D554F1